MLLALCSVFYLYACVYATDWTTAVVYTGGTGYEGSIYRYFGAASTFAQSQAACAAWSANAFVVAINTAAEQDFVFSLKPTADEPMWIGAVRNRSLPGLVFAWADGSSSAAYANWRSGEPNDFRSSENCVVMGRRDTVGVGSQWNDAVCSFVLPFVCEQPRATGKLAGMYVSVYGRLESLMFMCSF